MKKAVLKHFLFNWRLHLFPVLVWFCAVLCVAVLFTHRAQRFEVLGIAQSQARQIAVTSPCRLSEVLVQPFERVAKDQVIAIANTVLDDEQSRDELQGQLQTISAEIEHLQAQLITTRDSFLANQSDRQTGRISDARRFAADVENATIEVLKLRVAIESDKITLENLALDVQITEELLEKQAVASYELQKIQNEYDSLAKKIEENENLLTQANAALETAKELQQQYMQQESYDPSLDGELEVIRKSIAVQQQRMNEVTIQLETLNARQRLEIKAPFDGIISRLLRSQSEVALAGDTIMTVTGTEITGIIGYATQDQMDGIREGMFVELIQNNGSGKIKAEQSTIIYIGPMVEQIPDRLLQNPNIPQWGRPFIVAAPEQMELVTGELLGIRRL